MSDKGVFVTGTDTAVGKTIAACGMLAALARTGMNVCGFKPVAAGAESRVAGLRNPDAELLMHFSSGDLDYDEVNPVLVEAAIAPHIALEQEGRCFEMQVVRRAFDSLAGRHDFVVVEGAGGWLVPLGGATDMAGLAGELDLPVVLVVGVRLGCINHSLLSAEAIEARGLKLAGWIANCMEPDMPALVENLNTLEKALPGPRLAALPRLPEEDELGKAVRAASVFDAARLRAELITD